MSSVNQPAARLRSRRFVGSNRIGWKSWQEPAVSESGHNVVVSVRWVTPDLPPPPGKNGENGQTAASENCSPPSRSVDHGASLPPPSPVATERRRGNAVESEREAIERKLAARKLAEKLLAGCTNLGDAANPLELLAAEVGRAARLEAELAAVSMERASLEDALQVAEKRLREEQIRADTAVERLRVATSAPVGEVVDEIAHSGGVSTPTAPAPVQDQCVSNSSPLEQIETIRQERLEGFQSATLREMFLGCIELLAADIYASQAHFVLELLQNADDNQFSCMKDGEVPTARFRLNAGSASQQDSPAYVLVANNEVGLTPQDVLGLCAISKSSKVGKKDKTGRKGIGFKSVFAVSSCPHILSGPYKFKFDVRSDRMGYITPTWVDESEELTLPQEVLEMHRDGSTCFYLPAGKGCDASQLGIIAEVECSLASLDPATLLFLRRLRRIEMTCADARHLTFEYEGPGPPATAVTREAVRVTSVSASQVSEVAHHAFFVCRKQGGGCGDVVVALPATTAGQGPGPPLQRAFATLPLCYTGLAIAINADWDICASRDGVHENVRNERIIDAAVEAFVAAIKELGPELPSAPLEYLGDRAPLSRFWRQARAKFLDAVLLAGVPCILVEDGSAAPRLALPSAALQRPGPSSTGAEHRAAALVAVPMLREATGKSFACEPLPAGVRLEAFCIRHFALCLPHLVLEALSLASEDGRVQRLAKLYGVLLDMLLELASSASPPLQLDERVALVRSAAIFPVCLKNGQAVLCALDTGPIFVSATETDLPQDVATAFLPSSESDAAKRGRLRILTADARKAVPEPLCTELQALRLQATRQHLLGLSLELHASIDEAEPCDLDTVWASLLLLRDASSTELPERGSEVDPLVAQGQGLLENPRESSAIIFVPSSDQSLRHAAALLCPWFLGAAVVCPEEQKAGEEQRSHETGLFAGFPWGGVWDDAERGEVLRWERFFVEWLGMRTSIEHLAMPRFRSPSQQVIRQLCSHKWWADVADISLHSHGVESFILWFVEKHARELSALRVDDSSMMWALKDHMSADFSRFFLGMKTSQAAPPLLSACAPELSPLARKCLALLDVTMEVDDVSLVNKCLPVLFRYGQEAHLQNYAALYGALQSCEGVLEALSSRIYIPAHGAVEAKSCVFFEDRLEGFAVLVGKHDLRLHYPEMQGFFADLLAVPTTLSSEQCISGLQALRRNGGDLELTTQMRLAACAYTELAQRYVQDYKAELMAAFEAEALIMLPPAELEDPAVSLLPRWMTCKQCCWYDAPGGVEIQVASLQRHYPVELKEFFTEALNIKEVDVQELQDRIAKVHSTPGMSVSQAYQQMDLVRTGLSPAVAGQLRDAIRGNILIPASASVSAEECVFLREGCSNAAAFASRVDLSAHYPELRSFFTEFLAVEQMLTVDQLLHALRAMKTKSQQEGSSGSLVLAAESVYKLLHEQVADSASSMNVIGVFQREGLLLLEHQSVFHWCTSKECMWFDIPVARGTMFSLESQYAASLRPFFCEVAHVCEVDASEISARLRCTASAVDAGLSCAYQHVERIFRESKSASMEIVREELRCSIFLAGATDPLNAEQCVFLPQEDACLASLVPGKVDLAQHFPGMGHFFTDCIGVRSQLSFEECLAALRSLSDGVVAVGRSDAPIALFRMLERLSKGNQGQLEIMISILSEQKLIYVGKGTAGRWHTSKTCMWHDLPHGVEAKIASLEHTYPVELRDFFVESLGVCEVSPTEVLARFEVLAQVAEAPKQSRSLLEAYKQIDAFCDTREGGSTEHVWPDAPLSLWSALVAAPTMVIPGQGSVPRAECVFLPDACDGLAELAGKIDLCQYYPDLRHYFVERLGLRESLCTVDCLAALRTLRHQQTSGTTEQARKLASQAMALYSFLQADYGTSMQLVDLCVLFEEQPLLFVPRTDEQLAARVVQESWHRSSACMWHDIPAGVEVDCVSLEALFPASLRQFAMEVVGVPALDAEEVASRLDRLQGAGIDSAPTFAKAYWDLFNARQAQRNDRELVRVLQERVFVPGSGFQPHSNCIWCSDSRSSGDGGGDAAALGRHDLAALYRGALAGLHADSLKAYFAEWLHVAEHITLEQCLEGLRELRGRHSDAGATVEQVERLDAARALYMELAHALAESTEKEIAATSSSFWQEALVYLPTLDSPNGRWSSAEQCIWMAPEEAPVGWILPRFELLPHYGDEPDFKALFTEKLGIPISIRFSEDEEEITTQEAPCGQPLWLLAPTKGKKLVSQPKSSPPPQRRSERNTEEVQSNGLPPQVARGMSPVNTEDDGEPPAGEEVDKDASPAREDDKGREEDRIDDHELDATSGRAGRRLDDASVEKARSFEPEGASGGVSQVPRGDPRQLIEGDAPPPPAPPPEPTTQVRGVAADGRRERRKLLERLARSVLTSNGQKMSSAANRQKHRPDECLDCNPQHDLDRVACLEGCAPNGAPALIPIWAERQGKRNALNRIQAAQGEVLEKFAALLMSLAQLFCVSCRERIHIFEEDTQTVAFNGGALFFNLRYFVEERHIESWEEAVSFWTISFAHELAHFESPIHDRHHGRAMEHAQRAVLPGLPEVLSTPWGIGDGRLRPPVWRLNYEPASSD